jgi:Cu(I)/Ag(I) efflux system periplasmic protein CusF
MISKLLLSVRSDCLKASTQGCRCIALLAVATLISCVTNKQTTTQTGSSQPASQNVSGPAAAVQTTTYQGVGVVKSVNPKLPSIEIDHQEIKGLMEGMTMEFHVRDKSLLQGLAAGDHIEFNIESGVGGLKITAIRKI